MNKKTKNFDTFWFKSRTKLIPWHVVLLPFTTIPYLCIRNKYMTLMSLSDAKYYNADFRNKKDNIPIENGHGWNHLVNLLYLLYLLVFSSFFTLQPLSIYYIYYIHIYIYMLYIYHIIYIKLLLFLYILFTFMYTFYIFSCYFLLFYVF